MDAAITPREDACSRCDDDGRECAVCNHSRRMHFLAWMAAGVMEAAAEWLREGDSNLMSLALWKVFVLNTFLRPRGLELVVSETDGWKVMEVARE